MRVRIGNQTSFSAPVVMQPFEYAAASGFDAFEWFPDRRKSGEGWTENDLKRETRNAIRETALSRDIRLSVHASWEANPLRQTSQEPLDKAIELARDIGAKVFNIHLSLDEGVEAFGDSIIPLARQLAVLGIGLSIENTPHTQPEDFNELFRHIRSKGPDDLSSVGMCFDLGHANLCQATRNDYLRFLDLLEPGVPIIHVHLHENYGEADSHLTLFTGPSQRDGSGIRGVIERLVSRSFSGSIILEQWPQPPALLAEARDRLLALLRDTGEHRRPAGGSHGDGPAERVADADRRFRSWRKKLSWIHEMLADAVHPPDIDMLGYLAIYLRFIGTGAVPCSEEGGHFRPSHHAKTSRDIYDHLARITTPENVLVIRKIMPWLPSFDSAFIRQEPLTRIRDIAHRNDIPRELKEEIKHTLQNKLHRSAGPEDLITSAGLLQRITRSDAGYSPSFVEEFRRFHQELKEFFNARSLEEQLEAVALKDHDGAGGLVRCFLDAKEKAETPDQMAEVLGFLTALRRKLNERIPGETGFVRHQFQLADIGLEDFSFVLLSRLINALEATKDGMPWEVVLDSHALAVENLGLSGFEGPECSAAEAELNAWSPVFMPDNHNEVLRLRATLDRCRRLVERYTREVLSLFQERAERLGDALGVAKERVRLYTEGDIRGHPVYQISKLCSLIEVNTPLLARLSPWGVIVPGQATGILVKVARAAEMPPSSEDRIVWLVDKMEGDEEIPRGVVGLIVAHEIPHLSHLAIRARQSGIVFASCHDPAQFSELQALAGKRINLTASVEGVSVGTSAVSRGLREEESPRQKRSLPGVLFTPEGKVLALSQVSLKTGGSKAWGARRLQELSRLPGSGFKALPGLVIPFGVMEASLHGAPSQEEQYLRIVEGLNGLAKGELDEALRRLREVITGLPVSHDLIVSVRENFRESDRLMVRSSADSEDLIGFSGAGLYESIPNVPVAEVTRAISRVWSSLWTRRAVEGRMNAGIDLGGAHMAVLIQPMGAVDYSFVLHTANPVNGSPEEIYIELAVGMGETLASVGSPGMPYRLVYHRGAEAVRTLALASFSTSVWPDPSGGMVTRVVDYSETRLTTDDALRDRIGTILGRAGRFVEQAFAGPQDIEGFISGEAVYLVQSRPQQGTTASIPD